MLINEMLLFGVFNPTLHTNSIATWQIKFMRFKLTHFNGLKDMPLKAFKEFVNQHNFSALRFNCAYAKT